MSYPDPKMYKRWEDWAYALLSEVNKEPTAKRQELGLKQLTATMFASEYSLFYFKRFPTAT